MLLYEFEGKQLFKNCGINVPMSQLLESPKDQVSLVGDVIFKAQVLSGKRADAGGISKENNLFGKTINGEKVEKVLVEELVDIDKEYYLSFSYSTETRGPVMTFGKGGTGVEKGVTKTYQVDILKGFVSPKDFPSELIDVAEKLWQVFTKYDCELAEINPLAIVKRDPSTRSARSGQNYVVALDAKIILDDDSDFRREIKFPQRNLFGRASTESEIEARKIDEGDHRGTAGSVYWDLDGDIAVIAAGGGGSIVNMDALISLGGKPANYTEHSGNPPREKLKRLTKIVLQKPNLKGCWFVGGTANFTDIYETLMGFVEGLREVSPKPNYPIVIRRGGPNDKKAFEELKQIGEKEGFEFHIFGRETPMTSTAKTIVDLAYKEDKKIRG